MRRRREEEKKAGRKIWEQGTDRKKITEKETAEGKRGTRWLFSAVPNTAVSCSGIANAENNNRDVCCAFRTA
jgi:hypothetical protein